MEGWSGPSLTLAELDLTPERVNPNLVLLQNLGRTLTNPPLLGLRVAEPYPGARKAPAHLSLPSLSQNSHCQPSLLWGHLHGHRGDQGAHPSSLQHP